MLSCRPIIEKMTDFLEGKLGAFARVGFEVHVRTCWQCRQYLEQLRTVIATLGRLPEPLPAAGPSPELLARLHGALRDATPRERPPGPG